MICSLHVPWQVVHRKPLLASAILPGTVRFGRHRLRRRSKGRIVRSLRMGNVPRVGLLIRGGLLGRVTWADKGDVAAFTRGAMGEV